MFSLGGMAYRPYNTCNSIRTYMYIILQQLMNLQFCMEISFLPGRISLSVLMSSVVTILHVNAHDIGTGAVEEAKHIRTKNLERST